MRQPRRDHRKRAPARTPGQRYTTDSYHRAIARACEQAFPPPKHLARIRVKAVKGTRWETNDEWRDRLGQAGWNELSAWRKRHHWSPNQLRHNAATELRKQFGIEAARVVLGHTSAVVTEIYAEMDFAKAEHFAGRVDAKEFVRAEHREPAPVQPPWQRDPLEPGTDYLPVITPNNITLEHRIIDGVKVYHLIAEQVHHEFAPGLEAHLWGYNGRVHGPTIEAVEGDRVRIYVTNRLRTPTTVHWHAALLPSGMDGVSGLSQEPIAPGQTFRYEWTFGQHGTLFYHSHFDEMTQIGMGLAGMLIVHPRDRRAIPQVDRDFAILLHEWHIPPGTARPDPGEMSDFDVLTFNAKVFPATAPLIAQQGDRVRIRIANISIDNNHPIHLHGHHFRIAATDGGRIPEAGQWPESTVLVPIGASRDVEFIADNPGDWAMHCHMTHHQMNQMGHGAPNMIGMDPRKIDEFDERMQQLLPGYMTMGHKGMHEHPMHIEAGHMDVPRNSIPMIGAPGPKGYITMGGMFTILKVREHIHDYTVDPGWYEDPEGTLARPATMEELRHDGIHP